MSEEKADQTVRDPFAPMVDFYDNWTKTWAKAMSEIVTSERFADSMAQQMETGLQTMALFRRQVNEAMEQYLRTMNLPTGSEVTNLAERLTRVEMSIDDLDAKLDAILDQLKAMQKG